MDEYMFDDPTTKRQKSTSIGSRRTQSKVSIFLTCKSLRSTCPLSLNHHNFQCLLNPVFSMSLFKKCCSFTFKSTPYQNGMINDIVGRTIEIKLKEYNPCDDFRPIVTPNKGSGCSACKSAVYQIARQS